MEVGTPSRSRQSAGAALLGIGSIAHDLRIDVLDAVPGEREQERDERRERGLPVQGSWLTSRT
jgi:hypothetical protein